MVELIEIYHRLLASTSGKFERYLMPELQKSRRLTGIIGARGTGKTTLLLQFAKSIIDAAAVLYVSMEEFYFKRNKLIDLADEFFKKGGKYLLLDEVHRYPGWSTEIKLIYDRYPDLNVIFTGSSLVELQKGKADLSRRAVMHELSGLSLREFINMRSPITLQSVTFQEIVDHHVDISREIIKQVRPFEHFEDYLKFGYYPFFTESIDDYHQKLRQVVDLSLSIDMPASFGISYASSERIAQMLGIISVSVPFKPDITALSSQVAIDRNTFIKYLGYLEDMQLVRRLYSSVEGMGQMRKPEKLYLNNTNLMWALGSAAPEKGNIRETFLLNQLSHIQHVYYPSNGDFEVDKYIFEVGGKTKKRKQIIDQPHGIIVKDDIEIGMKGTIPLWLFGWLY